MVNIDIELTTMVCVNWLDSNEFRNCITGLFLNDCYESTPEVEEAIRRLPADVFDARNKRIYKAFQASFTKTYLPKAEWTKYEEDVKYLEPYLDEVKREKAEREAYEHNNFETAH